LKRVNVNNIVVFFVFLAFLAGCSQEVKPDVDRLAHAYAKILFYEEYYRGVPDSVDYYRNEALKEVGLTEREFEKEMKALSPDRNEWKRFFQKTEKYLKDIRRK
jgi:hypothetical protein